MFRKHLCIADENNNLNLNLIETMNKFLSPRESKTVDQGFKDTSKQKRKGTDLDKAFKRSFQNASETTDFSNAPVKSSLSYTIEAKTKDFISSKVHIINYEDTVEEEDSISKLIAKYSYLPTPEHEEVKNEEDQSKSIDNIHHNHEQVFDQPDVETDYSNHSIKSLLHMFNSRIKDPAMLSMFGTKAEEPYELNTISPPKEEPPDEHSISYVEGMNDFKEKVLMASPRSQWSTPPAVAVDRAYLVTPTPSAHASAHDQVEEGHINERKSSIEEYKLVPLPSYSSDSHTDGELTADIRLRGGGGARGQTAQTVRLVAGDDHAPHCRCVACLLKHLQQALSGSPEVTGDDPDAEMRIRVNPRKTSIASESGADLKKANQKLSFDDGSSITEFKLKASNTKPSNSGLSSQQNVKATYDDPTQLQTYRVNPKQMHSSLTSKQRSRPTDNNTTLSFKENPSPSPFQETSQELKKQSNSSQFQGKNKSRQITTGVRQDSINRDTRQNSLQKDSLKKGIVNTTLQNTPDAQSSIKTSMQVKRIAASKHHRHDVDSSYRYGSNERPSRSQAVSNSEHDESGSDLSATTVAAAVTEAVAGAVTGGSMEATTGVEPDVSLRVIQPRYSDKQREVEARMLDMPEAEEEDEVVGIKLSLSDLGKEQGDPFGRRRPVYLEAEGEPLELLIDADTADSTQLAIEKVKAKAKNGTGFEKIRIRLEIKEGERNENIIPKEEKNGEEPETNMQVVSDISGANDKIDENAIESVDRQDTKDKPVTQSKTDTGTSPVFSKAKNLSKRAMRDRISPEDKSKIDNEKKKKRKPRSPSKSSPKMSSSRISSQTTSKRWRSPIKTVLAPVIRHPYPSGPRPETFDDISKQRQQVLNKLTNMKLKSFDYDSTHSAPTSPERPRSPDNQEPQPGKRSNHYDSHNNISSSNKTNAESTVAGQAFSYYEHWKNQGITQRLKKKETRFLDEVSVFDDESGKLKINNNTDLINRKPIPGHTTFSPVQAMQRVLTIHNEHIEPRAASNSSYTPFYAIGLAHGDSPTSPGSNLHHLHLNNPQSHISKFTG